MRSLFEHCSQVAERYTLGPLLIIVFIASVSGCGSGARLSDMVPIRGEVLYKGKPLTEGEGTVVYMPTEAGGEARRATGAIQPDGSFTLTTLDPGDGAMKGKYTIVVYCYQPHPGEPKTREEREKMVRAGGIKRGSYIPEKYAKPATSGLTDIVDDSHTGFKRIELTDE
jgi:hypothetical protein